MFSEHAPIHIIALNTDGLDAAFRGPERVIFTCTATCGNPTHPGFSHIWHHDENDGSVAHIQTGQELRMKLTNLLLDALLVHGETGCDDVPHISVFVGQRRLNFSKAV